MLLGALALGGCGEVVPAQPDAGPSGTGIGLAASFEVVVTPTFEPGGQDPGLLPDQHAFVLRLNDAGTGTSAIAGTWGTVQTGRFDRLSTGIRQLAEPMRVAVVPAEQPQTGCNGAAMSYESMQLTPLDGDDDGMADSLRGTATGHFERVTGDVVEVVGFEATLEATLDTVSPALAFAGPENGHDPLAPIHVIASEPLPGNVVLSLRSLATGQIFALSPVDGVAPAAAHFATAADVLLPFDDALLLEVEPALQDMAGNEGFTTSAPLLQTLPGPGDFVADGFESDLNGYLEGDTQLVERIGEVPAILDFQSLLLGPGGRITVQIPIGNFGTTLWFDYRLLFQTPDGGDMTGEIVFAAPGQELVRLPLSVTPALPAELIATGDPMWPYAGPVLTFGQELPYADLPEQIFVSVQITAPPACFGPVPPLPAILLDDLHID